ASNPALHEESEHSSTTTESSRLSTDHSVANTRTLTPCSIIDEASLRRCSPLHTTTTSVTTRLGLAQHLTSLLSLRTVFQMFRLCAQARMASSLRGGPISWLRQRMAVSISTPRTWWTSPGIGGWTTSPTTSPRCIPKLSTGPWTKTESSIPFTLSFTIPATAPTTPRTSRRCCRTYHRPPHANGLISSPIGGGSLQTFTSDTRTPNRGHWT